MQQQYNMLSGHKFVFDTETTGLPPRRVKYRNLDAYNNARLVSISWIILDERNEIVNQEYHLIYPSDFVIPENSIRIHGITQDKAEQEGIHIHDLLTTIHNLCIQYNFSQIVAHNLQFDINVLRSELYRYNNHTTLDIISNIPTRVCTMLKTMKLLNMPKFPKLKEAFEILYEMPITNEHNAKADTYHCYMVYTKIMQYPMIHQMLVDDTIKYASNRSNNNTTT